MRNEVGKVSEDKRLRRELRKSMFLRELDKIEELAMRCCTETGTCTSVGTLCMKIVGLTSSLKDDILDPTLYNDSQVDMDTLSRYLKIGKNAMFNRLRVYGVFDTRNRPMPEYEEWFSVEVKTYYSDTGYKCKRVVVYAKKEYVRELKKIVFPGNVRDLHL